MKIKTDTPVESGSTTTLNEIKTVIIKTSDLQTPKVVGFDEIVYEKIIKLEEQIKLISEKLDKILEEKEFTYYSVSSYDFPENPYEGQYWHMNEKLYRYLDNIWVQLK